MMIKKLINLGIILGMAYIAINTLAFIVDMMEKNIFVFITIALITWRLIKKEID